MKTGRLSIAVAMVLHLGLRVAMCQSVPPPPRPEGMRVDPDPAQLHQILDDLHAGKAQAALAEANEMLRTYPDSIWLNCAAGEAAVANDDRLSLHLVIERLKRLSPPGQESCISKLGTQYKRATATVEIRQRALDLVTAGKLDEARRVVAGAKLEPYEDLLIEHYLDRAETHFANALSRLNQLKGAIPSSANEATELREETMRQAREFSALRERARAYLFDPVATSACDPKSERDVFDRRGFALNEFFGIARDLAREYPSNPDAQQFYFTALLLAGPEKSLKRYGDSVLTRYGTLTIPFFSRDSLYLLVLDRRRHRISLRENPAHPKNMGRTDGLRGGKEFDLDYSAVSSLHQVISSNVYTHELNEMSAALDFGEQGVAPYYALMPAIHCLYGERYERQATERLGKFVATELDLPSDRVKLVNPEGTTHDVLGTILSVVTIASAGATQISILHQQQEPDNTTSLLDSLPFHQLQASMIQSTGEEIMEQQRAEASERQVTNDEQRAETISFEQELAEQGFNRALDLDVPGYLEILGDMLHKRN